MKALILALKKIITVITAILVPASSVTPGALYTKKEPVKASTIEVVVAQEDKKDSEYVIVNDSDNTQNKTDESQETPDAPVNEPAAETPAEPTTPEPEEPAKEFTAVKTWDVSATEDDNVTMSFYDTEDTDALLEQLTGKITALFTPMVAYAADDRTVDSTEERDVITEGNSTITINKDGIIDTGDGEHGSTGGETHEEETLPGTVVVSGTGEMMDYVYNYFMSPELYIKEMTALFKEYQNVDVTPIYDETLTDVVEIDQSVVWQITGSDPAQYAEVTDEMRDNLNSTAMLKYSPSTVIIKDGVTNISDYAFLTCGGIQKVIIPEGVTRIGDYAFGYCQNLEEITLPASLLDISYAAFAYCSSLNKITVNGSLRWISYDAFMNIGENATVYYTDDAVLNQFNNDTIDAGVSFVKVTTPVAEGSPEVNNAE